MRLWYLFQGDAPRGESTRFRLVLSGSGLEVNDYWTTTPPNSSLYDAAVRAYDARIDERVAIQGREAGGRVFTLLADAAGERLFRLVLSSPGGAASPIGLGSDFTFSGPVLAAMDAGNPNPDRDDTIAWSPGSCGPLASVDALLGERGLTDIPVRANLVQGTGENRRLFGAFIAATPDRRQWAWLYGEKPRGEGSETACVYATGSDLDLRDYVSYKKVYENQVDLGKINGEDFIGMQGRLNEFFSDEAWEQYEELIVLGGTVERPDPPVDSVAAGYYFRDEVSLAACRTLENERWREVCKPYKQLVRQLKHDSGLHIAVQGEANIKDSKSLGILTLMAHDAEPNSSVLLFTTFAGATIRYVGVRDLEFSQQVLAGFEAVGP